MRWRALIFRDYAGSVSLHTTMSDLVVCKVRENYMHGYRIKVTGLRIKVTVHSIKPDLVVSIEFAIIKCTVTVIYRN